MRSPKAPPWFVRAYQMAFVVVGFGRMAVACQHGLSSTPDSSAPVPPVTVSAPVQATPTSVPEPVVDSPPAGDECTPGDRLDPATLEAVWPARVGTRVRLKSHVDRSSDVTDVIISAGGHRFLVLVSPDKLWVGEKDQTFTVAGSKTIALSGRTTLPYLLLEPECAK